MEAYSAGSRKNLKHDEEKPHAAGSKTEKNDEEKPHAAGSKTEKKRKEVLKKIKDDEKEPHAAGSKKKKPLLPDRTFEEILQVKEEPEEEPGWKLKTVKLKLTTVDLKHFEGYTPSPPYRPNHFDTTDPRMFIALERAAARHQARLERRKRAVQQVKDKGFAELEVELLDDLQECNGFAEIEKFLDDPEV